MGVVDGLGRQLRLPQDVAEGDVRGVPDFGRLRRSGAVYARRRDAAVRAGDFSRRAEACWGLVARGTDSLHWCVAGLRSGDEDLASDAAGVLRWVGVPVSWQPLLRQVLESLPAGEAADALAEALPEVIAADAEPAPGPAEAGLLFEGRLRPFTEPIWFIDAPLVTVAEEMRAWLGGIPGRRDSFSAVSGPLQAMLERLEPWSFTGQRALLVDTTGGWTAMFTQGRDLDSATSVLSERLRCRGLKTHYSRHVVREGRVRNYGNRSFWLHTGDGRSRTLQASQQGRWEWHAYGDPQPFEDLEAYTAKRIPDRLTLQRLNEYCRALGIARDDPDFYRPVGLLTEPDTSTWPTSSARINSGAEWRREFL